MKLSIITINLNNAKGLIKTIGSVLNQTSHNFEYIIIDGNSTDNSIDVIKSFTYIQPGVYNELNHISRDSAKSSALPNSQDNLSTISLDLETYHEKSLHNSRTRLTNPISYWISEPDRGIYHAMNKGIMVSKGEFCQFLNSGDWLAEPTVTEKMLETMPNCNIYYGNMVKQMPNGRMLYNKEIPVNSFLTFYNGTLNHSSAYIKHSLFTKYGMYDENLKIVSDWKFFLIAIALNSEKVCYRDLDVTCFDMKGISNIEKEIDETERKKVLQEIIPSNILYDYEKYSAYIIQMKRLNRFRIISGMVWFCERILFKLEKFETRFKKKHLFY